MLFDTRFQGFDLKTRFQMSNSGLGVGFMQLGEIVSQWFWYKNHKNFFKKYNSRDTPVPDIAVSWQLALRIGGCHLSIDTKLCKGCNQRLPLSKFEVGKNTKGTYTRQTCRSCVGIQRRKRFSSNPRGYFQQALQYSKSSYKKNNNTY